ncbi:MAG: PIN domain-containing protein [Planctomycetota bacterium]|jgi:predicted nucleic acid-binding protein|nr:PIN domain-containing protein [Planctomycetota bacterium]
MNVIIDTNVVLDVLANRIPFAKASAEAIALAEQNGCLLAITANAVTDLYFLLLRHLSDVVRAKTLLKGAVERIVVLDTTREICLSAFKSPISDFEDAVLVESALRWGADCIVTRNTRDFAASPVEAITPDELLHRFAN